MELKKDITDEEMDKLLNIKICDYDWLFMWSNPTYNKNSLYISLYFHFNIRIHIKF